jgi:malonyl-CoA/methylmalonyl-CoA synthetase
LTVTLLSTLACNAIAVPLAPSFPVVELRHIINNSGATFLLSTAIYAAQAQEVLKYGIDGTVCCFQLGDCHSSGLARSSEDVLELKLTELSGSNASGMMLFTSGTTARPKGVLLSDATLTAQAQSLLTAWQYSPSDHLLHILPLHHIHGTVNALLTPLLAGSSIEFMYPFDVNTVWERIASPFLHAATHGDTAGAKIAFHDAATPVTLFTAVPTVWARMLQAYDSLSPDLQQAGKEAVSRQNLRLNMSGSAALPKSIREGWTALSGGNILLERYGMTEVGMALSCGLDDADRIESSVGWPLPSVQVRLMEKDDEGKETLIALGEEVDPASNKERQGEIQLRGPTVFKEYWQNPAATEKEFTHDGWFKTGDIAIRKAIPGSGDSKSGSRASGPAYFIQGRQSADIIKTGGEKVSALEIEREILALPQVNEVVVVGLPSSGWGQKVAAVVVLSEECDQKSWNLAELRRQLKTRLVTYKIPQDLEIVPAIKRNAMGKVNKKELVPSIFGAPDAIRRRSLDLQEARNMAKKCSAK